MESIWDRGLGRLSAKKSRVTKVTHLSKMLPKFYQQVLQAHLTQSQHLNLGIIGSIAPKSTSSYLPWHEYFPKDYQAPDFNFNPLGNLFQLDLKMDNSKKKRSSR